jgi:glucose/arabinose dehydrogenase
LVKIEQGAWYGWPEYFKNKPATDSSLKAPGVEAPTFLWQSHPQLTKSFAMFDSHSATNGFAFSPSEKFGFKGDAFIAMFGSFTPITTGPNVELSGFSVVKVNMQNAKIESFASNKVPGPSYVNRLGGFNRPSDVVFGPDDSMYIIDWGAASLATKGLELKPETGVIWRIYNSNNQVALRPNGPIVIDPARVPKEDREPLARNVSETYRMVGKYFLPVGLVLLILILVFVARKRRS